MEAVMIGRQNLIRAHLTLWSIILFALFSPPAQSQDQLPDLVRRIKPSAVAIETFDARGEKLSRGSGFFIDVDRIVTNRHVIEGAYRAEVHLNSGNAYQVRSVAAVDAEGDLALLKIDAPPNLVRPLSLDRTSPQEGESIVVIGNPFGLEGSVTNGIVSAVRDIPGFGRIIQITAPISPGSSGSPVVNMQGQVIGVATLQITGGQSVNFAIPSERIAQLNRSVQAQGTQTMLLSELVVATRRLRTSSAVLSASNGIRQRLRRGVGADGLLRRKAEPARRCDRGFEESREYTTVCRILLQHRARQLPSEAISRSRSCLSPIDQTGSVQCRRCLLCTRVDVSRLRPV